MRYLFLGLFVVLLVAVVVYGIKLRRLLKAYSGISTEAKRTGGHVLVIVAIIAIAVLLFALSF